MVPDLGVLGPIATLLIVLLPRQPVDPMLDSGGWRPRPFARLDWIVLAVIVAVIVAFVVVASAGLNLRH